MLQLIRTPEVREKLVYNASEFVKEYVWESIWPVYPDLVG